MFGRMKELKGKDKIEYYLEYYGWRTVGVIAVCSIIIFLVIHFTTSKEIVSGIDATDYQVENVSGKVIKEIVNKRIK